MGCIAFLAGSRPETYGMRFSRPACVRAGGRGVRDLVRKGPWSGPERGRHKARQPCRPYPAVTSAVPAVTSAETAVTSAVPGRDRRVSVPGTSKLGGVLAVAGDDHACKSSTVPHQSELNLRDMNVPTLAPRLVS
eukprot:480656-Rhodomonas_salina.2